MHPRLVALARVPLRTPDVKYLPPRRGRSSRASVYEQAHHRDFLNHTVVVPSEDPSHRNVELFVWLSSVDEDLGPTESTGGRGRGGGSASHGRPTEHTGGGGGGVPDAMSCSRAGSPPRPVVGTKGRVGAAGAADGPHGCYELPVPRPQARVGQPATGLGARPTRWRSRPPPRQVPPANGALGADADRGRPSTARSASDTPRRAAKPSRRLRDRQPRPGAVRSPPSQRGAQRRPRRPGEPRRHALSPGARRRGAIEPGGMTAVTRSIRPSRRLSGVSCPRSPRAWLPGQRAPPARRRRSPRRRQENEAGYVHPSPTTPPFAPVNRVHCTPALTTVRRRTVAPAD